MGLRRADAKCAALTSELDFAGDVLLELSPQLWIVLKVVEMMFDPLAENIKNPAGQRRCHHTNKTILKRITITLIQL